MLTSVAVQVHDMERMTAFYAEAFGAVFEPVDTMGLASQFGRVGDLLLKFVPLRAAADFEGFPSHQLGFRVDDVDRVVALATKHGGRLEGELVREAGRVQGALRDPDGNTLEVVSEA
ncbi:MAG: VOC family protein [Planctomycetota bacterium]|nr:VOC family protein [Planctomycetota bacterium]